MTRPIQTTMETTLKEIRNMIDADTVIGDPITVDMTKTIIPFSRVSFGFVSGGGELDGSVLNKDAATLPESELNFIGGGASGVSVKPVGFIVCDEHGIKLLSAEYSSYADRIIDNIPHLIEEIKKIVSKECDQADQ